MFGVDSGLSGEWNEALNAAAVRLEPLGPYAHAFVELRDDWRARIDSRGVSETVPSTIAGAAVRGALGQHRTESLASPSPDQLLGLVDAVRNGERRRTAFVDLGARERPAPADLLGLLAPLAEACKRDMGGGVDSIVAATGVAFDQYVAIATAGRVVTDHRAGRRIRLEARAARGSSVAVVAADIVVRAEDRAEFSRVATEVAARVRERLTSPGVARADGPAVFAPGVGGLLLHEIVGHALESDVIERGGSWLERTRGAIGGAQLSVIDDPRRGRGAWRIDDEGQPSRAVALVRAGRVVGRLVDQGSSTRGGGPNTGSARRSSFREPVLPRMGCTFLAPGAADPADALRATSDGYYVRRMDAVACDPARGRAVFRVSDADRVRAGRTAEPLEPFVIEVDGSSVLRTIDAVAGDLAFDSCVGSCIRDGQPLAVSVGAPTFRIGLVRVLK